MRSLSTSPACSCAQYRYCYFEKKKLLLSSMLTIFQKPGDKIFVQMEYGCVGGFSPSLWAGLLCRVFFLRDDFSWFLNALVTIALLFLAFRHKLSSSLWCVFSQLNKLCCFTVETQLFKTLWRIFWLAPFALIPRISNNKWWFFSRDKLFTFYCCRHLDFLHIFFLLESYSSRLCPRNIVQEQL